MLDVIKFLELYLKILRFYPTFVEKKREGETTYFGHCLLAWLHWFGSDV